MRRYQCVHITTSRQVDLDPTSLDRHMIRGNEVTWVRVYTHSCSVECRLTRDISVFISIHHFLSSVKCDTNMGIFTVLYLYIVSWSTRFHMTGGIAQWQSIRLQIERSPVQLRLPPGSFLLFFSILIELL